LGLNIWLHLLIKKDTFTLLNFLFLFKLTNYLTEVRDPNFTLLVGSNLIILYLLEEVSGFLKKLKSNFVLKFFELQILQERCLLYFFVYFLPFCLLEGCQVINEFFSGFLILNVPTLCLNLLLKIVNGDIHFLICIDLELL